MNKGFYAYGFEVGFIGEVVEESVKEINQGAYVKFLLS